MNRRRLAALALFDLVAILAVTGLVALAVWQMQRRTWKLDLIERIEARVHAAPVPAPGPERWSDVSAAADEYRRVTLRGRWLAHSPPAFVMAVTEHGGGFWVMTPFASEDGATVLINRGFVPADRRDPAFWRPLPTSGDTVTGLLRITEPGGAFLRTNDPSADRWFSRDVAAIAASRGLDRVAPYFIDRVATPGESGLPIPGLTVIAFSNNHLVYAITWAALALMAAAGGLFVHVEALRRSGPRKRAPALEKPAEGS